MLSPWAARWRFTARHVPELFWRDAYEADFAPLLPSARAAPARRFCSVALVKLVEGCTWPQAAERLGCSPSGVVQYMFRVRRAGPAAFSERLHRFADRYDHGPLTDYGARRAAFRELSTLSPAEWHAICRAAGVPPGRGPRLLAASAWIWSAVTGGDWRSAPSAPHTEGFLKAYRDFEANVLRRVERGLLAYAEGLLRNL